MDRVKIEYFTIYKSSACSLFQDMLPGVGLSILYFSISALAILWIYLRYGSTVHEMYPVTRRLPAMPLNTFLRKFWIVTWLPFCTHWECSFPQLWHIPCSKTHRKYRGGWMASEPVWTALPCPLLLTRTSLHERRCTYLGGVFGDGLLELLEVALETFLLLGHLLLEFLLEVHVLFLGFLPDPPILADLWHEYNINGKFNWVYWIISPEPNPSKRIKIISWTIAIQLLSFDVTVFEWKKCRLGRIRWS